MVETYRAVVELLDRDPDERRADAVRAELAGYVPEVIRTERGYLAAHISLRADNLTEAAGTAVVVAQAAAQAPAISVQVFPGPDLSALPTVWRGGRESNPRNQFGRLRLYH